MSYPVRAEGLGKYVWNMECWSIQGKEFSPPLHLRVCVRVCVCVCVCEINSFLYELFLSQKYARVTVFFVSVFLYVFDRAASKRLFK